MLTRLSHCRIVAVNNSAAVRTVSSSSVTIPTNLPSEAAIPGEAGTFDKTAEIKRKMYRSLEESPYKLGKHRSNALELVHKVPIVEVDGEMAVCDGGGGALGHPLEYISLERPGAVEYCKYCALRFTKKEGSH